MKLLLHTCCGPCTIYPLSLLRKTYKVSAIFFNPNIHPYREFKKRRSTFLAYCESEKVPVLDAGSYGLTEFLRKVVFHENRRCRICYSWRLEETARRASEGGFSSFSTTLLYSRYQNHEEIRNVGLLLAKKYNIDFIYADFREGWQFGIDKSKELDMYRQPYCGCIFSEQERYDKSLYKNKR